MKKSPENTIDQPSVRATAARDSQLVTPAGLSVSPRIDGVVVRPTVTHPDDRGELVEVFDPAWGVHPDPLVYVYMATVRPGRIKGWVVHDVQDDRLFCCFGQLQVVLYDDRTDSLTHGMVNELFVGERNRTLVTIPAGVFHAVRNIGLTDAAFINMPTRPYDHAAPDKRRLALDTPLIPYRFESAR